MRVASFHKLAVRLGGYSGEAEGLQGRCIMQLATPENRQSTFSDDKSYLHA